MVSGFCMKYIIGIFGVVALVSGYFFYSNETQTSDDFLARVVQPDLEKSAQAIVKEETNNSQAVKVPIFVYHSVRPHLANESKEQEAFDVTPELFEQQLSYLKDNGYSTISFDALADHFDKGTSLPERAVILNFDDAWRNQYLYAFPLLKKYHFSATFFVPTSYINRRHFLKWADIDEMAAAGMVIGDHTKSHPYLSEITDAQQLRDEIIGSKKILEGHLKKTVTAFAYPFGHFKDDSVAVVKEVGLRVARSTYRGTTHTAQNRYALTSILVTDNFSDFTALLNRAK